MLIFKSYKDAATRNVLVWFCFSTTEKGFVKNQYYHRNRKHGPARYYLNKGKIIQKFFIENGKTIFDDF